MLTKGQILNALNCLNNELDELDMTGELLLTGGGTQSKTQDVEKYLLRNCAVRSAQIASKVRLFCYFFV